MTMPMAGGLRGGERLHNDDSRLALRRPVGVLRSPIENRPVRRSDQIDGVLAPLPRGIPSARETDQLTDSALCPTWDSATQHQLSAGRDKGPLA